MTPEDTPLTANPAQPMASGRILIIDDNAHSRQLIGAILTAVGYSELEYAVNGREGLEKAATFRPDIIVLDIMMPEMDGMEFMHHFRASTELGTTPILVQTALSSQDERNQIYASGASDMLTKPISSAELVTRVRTHLELRRLSQAYEEQMRIQAELDTASRMQEALLPPKNLITEVQDQTKLTIDSHFQTCSELGGDLWGVQAFGKTHVAIYTIDFSGHGLGAALNTFRLHTIMGHSRPRFENPAQYLTVLNDDLKEVLPLGQYATMFYGIIDIENNFLTYAGAGSPFPILGNLQSGEMDYIDSSGLPLGMKAGATYENRTIDFPIGTFLFLYSDALIETPDESGAVVNESTLTDILGECLKDDDRATPVDRLTQRFYARCARDPDDDLTMVLVSRPN